MKQKPIPRWGGVARCGHYRKLRKTASPIGICHAGSCTTVQNGDGTRGKKWHKSDTGGSPSVRANAGAQKQTAAPAGPRNGGNESEKHSGAFKENSYHNATAAATRAGRWYADNRKDCPQPIIPTLRRMFRLSALEAVQAIRVANGVRQ